MFNFPKTTTAKEVQQNYRRVFDLAKKTKEPIIVMRNNKPDVAILDVKRLEEMEAVIAVLKSREEAKTGRSKVLKGTLADLWHEIQAD